ncbi:UDP-glucose 4-epimerase GalE [Pseudarthrobacter sp. PS3-L1]|uniref:UDP-glucose 4-epimerase GalE n=1 Tax=Pseudarthrobacter sp. PS3-L1 TaxID=3046207 RepID=UPI0024B8ED59|nr:UDP-glucose 4-epimerase GalE [Pseudarthrobacter sp. PS3-L1]MDJ0321726.1 UDP-glucose 4-epimerase GalE [Pseudarthrobacter sp. PS3-L1]
MKILVTGGAGFIGSHTTLALLEAGHDVVVVDSLANSDVESLRRVSDLSKKTLTFRELDLLDVESLAEVFTETIFDAVVHFAGLKAVGESVTSPLLYYRNNVVGTLNLLDAMIEAGVKTFVFSSSATVYGDSDALPLTEGTPLGATNAYGRTKEQLEGILTDLVASDPAMSVAILRYFNPVGAHESGRIGEDPRGTPNNLLPFVAQVAVGRHEKVSIYGDDYDTPDGTGVRDYIHVMDLAEGHLAALDFLMSQKGVFRWNLGTGNGSSVLEVIRAFERAVGRNLPYAVAARRPGDSAMSFADSSAAKRDLGWSATRDLDQMCADHWRWQNTNPEGYTTSK